MYNLSTNITTNEIIDFLKVTDFFKDVPIETLYQLSKQFKWVNINGGETLMKEGEEGDCLFLVISGRFSTSTEVNQEHLMLNEIGRGELIGELALLTQRPRSVTVIAIRDSVLLKLSQKSFDAFIKNNPLVIGMIARTAILRLLSSKSRTPSKISSITIAPAGANINLEQFANEFVKLLKKYGPTLHLNSQKIRDIFKQQGTKNSTDAIFIDSELITWINKRESEYRYVVYETDLDYTEWTKRCLRQADRILFVCNAYENKALNEVEQKVYSDKFIIKKKLDLIFLYNDGSSPTKSVEWLNLRKVNAHYHIRKNLQTDFERLIRIVTGQCIALVLGGGGARALAHVGAYKALREIGIPIDLVGGSSFGALIGSAIAMDCTTDYLIENLKKRVISKTKLFFKRTIPIVSINSGVHITNGLKDYFGQDNYIEDLWKKFFCITCNLTQSKQEIRETGLIWRAIRASISIPVVFPPITNEDNDIFVDGAIVNNLPVDVMRQFANGGKIIAISTSLAKPFKAEIPDGDVSGLDLIYQRYIKKSKNFPTLMQMLLKSIGVCSREHEQKMISQADYSIIMNPENVDLMDFHAVDKLIEMGYRTTMEELTHESIAELLSCIK